MFRLRDLILLIVIYSSLLAGIFFPKACEVFQPFPLYCMMSLLFLSFLSISFSDISETLRRKGILIGVFLFIRMILLPAAVFFLFTAFWPKYSLSALLLTGIATGVVAPFISGLLHANTPLVLVMVVCSSLLVPFTLPPMVDMLCGRTMELSVWAMMRLLLMVVFVPVALAQLLKKISSIAVEALRRYQFYISLVIFAVTNMGIFSKYSNFFYQEPMTIVSATVVAFILAAVYLVAGILISWGRPIEDQVASVICLGIMNNVLVIVFSSQFFTPVEPTVAALYMIPFFGLIVPLRAYRGWQGGKEKSGR
ncbi:MAG: bile acid:sodium symporter [Desulfobacterota bacterium]|jgi:BASS family bile acid:Na+ symporter|nr:bile acid:sodium symporter [Thermodesulfobacteriota bacterium]